MKPFTDGPVGAGWKLSWIEAVARDFPNAQGAPLAVAVAISSRVDSHGVAKNVTQLWIAQRLGLGQRTVTQGFSHLVSRGYIVILKASRGRGQANEIKIIRKQPSESQQYPARQPSESQQDPARQPSESQQNSVQKLAEFGTKASEILRTLPSSLPLYSSLGEPNSAGFLDRRWATVLTRLCQPNRLGEGKVQSWLGNEKVRVGSLENGELTLVAGTRFLADRNRDDHGEMILREWQQIDPTITRVTFKHGPLPERLVGSPQPEQQPPKVVSMRERLEAKAVANGGKV